MNVYADECGDLGFTFDKPFRNGGSSHYLTIAFLLTPKKILHFPERIIRDIYKTRKRSPKNELKATELKAEDKLSFAKSVVQLLTNNPEIKLFSITVNKRNVENHIRQDPNKLYNYMTGLILPDYIKLFPLITFVPDPRSIKVNSGNSLADYLQIKLWFDMGVKTRINNRPRESHQELNIQFIDFISHIIWGKYEDCENDDSCKLLNSHISEKRLFF